jgi:hypothetical protein
MLMWIIFHHYFFEFVDSGGSVCMLIGVKMLAEGLDVLFDVGDTGIKFGGHL